MLVSSNSNSRAINVHNVCAVFCSLLDYVDAARVVCTRRSRKSWASYSSEIVLSQWLGYPYSEAT